MRLRYFLPIILLIAVLLTLSPERIIAAVTGDFGYKLAAAAIDDTRNVVIYDGRYKQIPYPWGDVAPNRGVCTDVVIRSYRALGIDLQQRVHRSIGGDANITHRRVEDLRRFFARHGQSLPVSKDPRSFKPGDIVTSIRPGGVTHIGIVTARWSWDFKRRLIVHNEGFGPKLDDALFEYPITGHYRYQSPEGGDLASKPASAAAIPRADD